METGKETILQQIVTNPVINLRLLLITLPDRKLQNIVTILLQLNLITNRWPTKIYWVQVYFQELSQSFIILSTWLYIKKTKDEIIPTPIWKISHWK